MSEGFPLSRADVESFLKLEDLSAACTFLKARPDLVQSDLAGYLSSLLDLVPLSRRLRDRYELFARLVADASRTGLDTAYANLSRAETESRSDPEWLQLGLRVLTAETPDVTKALLDQYPEIPRDAVIAAGQAELRQARGKEADRLRERLRLLEEWPRLLVLWQLQVEGEAEERLRKEPSIAALREVTERLRAVLANPEVLKAPPATQAELWERSASMHYSLFLNAYESPILDRAIADARMARELGSSGVVGLLTAALVKRYEFAGSSADLDAVIEVLSPVAHDLRDENAPLITNLANALRNRAEVRGDPDDVERAIQLFEWLAALPTDFARHQVRLFNLAAGLMTRYDRLADLRDIDRAIDIYEEVNKEIPDHSPIKTTLYNNFGLALLKRLRDSDLERAQQILNKSVTLLPADSPELSRNLTNAARGWLAAYNRAKLPEMLDAAIDSLSQAAERPIWNSATPLTLVLLSDALLKRFKQTGNADDLEQSVTLAVKSAEHWPRDSPGFRQAQLQGAVALQARGAQKGNRADFTRALELFRAAMPKIIQEIPLVALEHSINFGGNAYQGGRWEEASEALLFALDAHKRVLESQADTASKEIRLKRVQGLGAEAADALIHTGHLAGAVSALERGRAALAAQAIGTKVRDAATPQAIGPDHPLIYLENFDRGFALIVTQDNIRVLQLPELTEAEITRWLGHNVPNRIVDPPRWAEALDAICRRLWDIAMGPVLETIAGFKQATLIAGGYLGMLPLHASWREDPASPTGRYYVADAISLRYAPNAALLRRPRPNGPASLLCVDEPQPVQAAPLPFSAEETAAACAHFANPVVLKGKQATVSAALSRIPHCSALHLSCHGFTNPQNPRKNGFLMANGEMLTLECLLGLKLESLELAFLSACDVGQAGAVLPDEAIGIPTGLLQSGALGVISPLWPVISWGTVLLVARFYELWMHAGHSAPEALRGAQRWLRDTTNEEKALHLQSREKLHRFLLTREPKQRDHQAIYEWAPFYYCGV